ncbi:CcdC protein domain-containing protein [Sphingomonas quercus]|uniref:Cytochrome c biogenesis protein CcdC n=1 Tax=Sphingomonas quercus TaxID=2842451 RepID=A0ABS6BLU7_9SPHN|nr:CcdC protein domain-containing protein [Sphingomonas quercus]MBU3079292.1 cytochrome c biogenesis protein CcdC [Sphingomonas quercus]
MTAGHPPQLLGYVVPAFAVLLVLALRIRRMGRPRRLRLERLWIVPTLYGVIAAAVIAARPPGAPGWLMMGVALLVGGAIGWQRGRTMHVEIDPETHQLSERASPAAMLLLVALIAVRAGLRAVAGQAEAWHVDAVTVADVLLAFALGMLAMTRVEMGLRARRLLEEARARKAP